MELWIRSQNKEKLISNCSFLIKDWGDKCWIECIIHEERLLLGSYKTKERALEVLDEIQSKLTSNKIVMQLDRNVHGKEEIIALFNDKYNIKLLPNCATLKSVPNDIVIYEMPVE